MPSGVRHGDSATVARFARHVGSEVNREPVSAAVEPHPDALSITDAHSGRTLDSVALRRRIRRTLSREEGEDLILRAYMSEDFREGMDAFVARRAPS